MTRFAWHTLKRTRLARRQLFGAALVLWTCAALAPAALGQDPVRLPPPQLGLPQPELALPQPQVALPQPASIAQAHLAAPPADNVCYRCHTINPLSALMISFYR